MFPLQIHPTISSRASSTPFSDHLSDRELYAWLMESGQLEGHIAPLSNSYVHMSPIGGCSEEDNAIYLAYYATEQERAWWKEDAPDEELPPRKPVAV